MLGVVCLILALLLCCWSGRVEVDTNVRVRVYGRKNRRRGDVSKSSEAGRRKHVEAEEMEEQQSNV